jgi:tetratricopeptide (TPR) repeat protein
MARDSWYRNTDWNGDIEAAFFAKLARARDKAQHLRIQAGTLAKTHPETALRLLERYFALGDHFDHAQAHVDRAMAFVALGDTEHAIESYEAALAVEERRPSLLTQAYLELPILIAVRQDKARYERALAVLERGRSRLRFPADRFCWHAAKALIEATRGRSAEAREHARLALEAAAAEHSGFHHHPTVGLVGDRYTDVRRELARVAA